MQTDNPIAAIAAHLIRRQFTPAGRAVVAMCRWVIPVLLVGFLLYRLSNIGWLKIWGARPSHVEFYLTLPAIFLVQPFADLMIFRRLWQAGNAITISVMLRKRYLDAVLLDYSGEAWFFRWSQENLDISARRRFDVVKDSNILSAGAGLLLVCMVLGLLLWSGEFQLGAAGVVPHWSVLGLAVLPLLLCLMLLGGGRRVTTLGKGEIAWTFAIHLMRGIVVLTLQFVLWWFSGALPSAVMCFDFVALQLLITRLPLIPNKDIIFAGAGIALTGNLGVPAPPVAAVLVIATLFDQLAGLFAVALPWCVHELSPGRSAERS